MAKPRVVWSVDSLDPFFEGFKEYLVAFGYSPASIEYRLRVADRFGKWLVESETRFEDIDEAVVESFVRGQARKLYCGTTFVGWMGPLLAFLRMTSRIAGLPPEAPAVAGSADEFIRSWTSYLVEERGIGVAKARVYAKFGELFLSWIQQDGPLRFREQLTAQAVTAFVLSRKPRIGVGQSQNEASQLRSLLRFLHGQGLVEDLAGVVPAVFSHRDSGVPKILSAEMVEDITHAIGAFPRTRYRNLAMLALVSQLGLRAQEVVNLMLEDIDWRAGTVKIRGKGGNRDTMPLPEDVGALLADYLEHDTHRGPGERHLFHTAIGPFGPLDASGLKAAVQNASRRSGHGPAGPHRFRHTLASRTLNAGASMEEVSQLLRHRSLSSTAIYAKVDFERLGLVTRPWPGPVSMVWTGGAS